MDASEDKFIRRMTNYCTYLPGKHVLPKSSLLYQKFMVLNAINCIQVNGIRISVELKQAIYNELFMKQKKVTLKKIEDFMERNGVISKEDTDSVTGVDTTINASLSSWKAFDRLMKTGTLNLQQVEDIIERSSYAEDKNRFVKWLARTYPNLSQEDCRYIKSLKLKDFGRLSAEFLTETYGVVDRTSGEASSILSAMWSTNKNLMELLSKDYTFGEAVEEYCKDYYSEHPRSLEDRLSEMYVSNAVKRPIYRTLAVVKDVVKAFGAPQKIFIEMARGGKPEDKGKRTKTRKQQILDFYQQCKHEDVPRLRAQLEAMGEYADNRLQGDKLFLYYMQLGRCMYSGTPIDVDKLGTNEYDIDHIYPQAYVKDDSILDNRVLCLSKLNGAKSDHYPIAADIRSSMHVFWQHLKDVGLITGEKFKRLTRSTPFSPDEKYGFIHRQLTETTQSTKAIATILKEKYPETEIVYVKAKLASEFRQEYEIYKSRLFNDLHHAVDAYLNVVVGNVYHGKFTKKWFNPDVSYSIKTKTLFDNPQYANGKMIWDGEKSIEKVKRIALKNNAHFTKFSFFKRGGLFDQQLVSAGPGLVPIKKGMDTEKYGGYNKSATLFFIPVQYTLGEKTETLIMSVEMMYGEQFLKDQTFARECAFRRLHHILKKPVDDIAFPMGMRPWKVNTMLSLDGFRVCITGVSGGGKCIIVQSMMAFSANPFWKYYLKKLEMFAEKIGRNPNYIYDMNYDKVTTEKNMELYDLYLEKMEKSIYRKRINCPTETLRKGREKFMSLDVKAQTLALLNIQQVFGRIASGIDLTVIGGAGKAATTNGFSTTVSNWKKNYTDIRIVDASPSGLWETKSENLLELL